MASPQRVLYAPAVVRFKKRNSLWFVALLVGCEPKEAMDPADILAEDPDFAEERGLAADEAAGPGTASRHAAAATYAQCEDAATRVEALGIAVALRERNPGASAVELDKQRDEQLLGAGARARIRKVASACVERSTTRDEALCIAHIDSEDEIDGCAR